jgi:hypothetical protein
MMLKSIKKIINKGALSANEMLQIAQHYEVPINNICSMYDFKKPRLNGCYVILIHPTPNSNGHWVGLYKRGKCMIYHDSYGTPPPSNITDKCKDYNLFWTEKEIQDLRSNHCGQYVINYFRHVINSNNPYIATEHYLNKYA